MRRLLSASDYCRARGNQIVEHSSDNETVLGSSWGLGGAAEQLIFIERRSRHNIPKMAKYCTRNVEINNLIDKIRKKFRVNLSGCVISDIVLLTTMADL